MRAAAIWLGLAACGAGGETGTVDAAVDAAVDATPADAGPDAGPRPFLCVFDYDLTLSSHLCPATDGNPDLHCRINTGCDTYGWYEQCLGINAREAVAACVERGAMIGIASHANADNCWTDKIVPILTEMQFPEWTDSPRYAASGLDWQYPALDDRAHWNCDDCAYTMDGTVAKPISVSRVMRYYGLDPASPVDRARVIFWDDTPGNITAVQTQMPEVHSILVPRNGTTGAEGGCGITTVEIAQGWAEAGAP